MVHLGDPESRRRIVQRLQALTADTPRSWGKMTASQMLCHLDDSFQVAMGGKKASPATGAFQRTVMKWGALYLPMPWPKGVPTRPEVEQTVGGTPPGNFKLDRERLIATIERFAGPTRPFANQSHPIFGTMSDRQWLRWGYLHADHHLRQFGV